MEIAGWLFNGEEGDGPKWRRDSTAIKLPQRCGFFHPERSVTTPNVPGEGRGRHSELEIVHKGGALRMLGSSSPR